MGIETYNPSASLNTVLGSIPVAEGMARADVDDAIRQLMAHLAQGGVGKMPAIPQMYGGVGDGVADDRAAIQSAIDSGRPVLIPALTVGTTYKVGGALNLPDQCQFIGQGSWPAVIKSTALSSPILNLNAADNCQVANLNLQYSGTPTAGADAILVNNCQTCSFRDLWISSSWNGIRITTGGNHSIVNLRNYSYENAGLLLQSTSDVVLTNFRFHAGDSIKGRSGGIRLEGPTEAFAASQGGITLGVYSLMSADYGTPARGVSPYFNRFSNVFFDSPLQQAAYLRSLAHTDFASCWFASAGHNEAVGYGSAGDFAGVDMDNCSHLRFVGGDIYNNGSFGALIYNTNKRISFQSMSFKRNGFDAPSSRAGVKVLANTTDFSVRGCVFDKDIDTTTYKMDLAVEVDAGTSDRYFVADNLLGGCTVTDGGTGTNKRIANNY